MAEDEGQGQSAKPVGRPKVLDNEGNIVEMLTLGFSVQQISKMLKISRPTVYRIMKDANVFRTYSDIDEPSLDDTIRELKSEHPNAGEVMVMGHLRAKGFRIQRQKVRNSIHRVDPVMEWFLVPVIDLVVECMMLHARTMFGISTGTINL